MACARGQLRAAQNAAGAPHLCMQPPSRVQSIPFQLKHRLLIEPHGPAKKQCPTCPHRVALNVAPAVCFFGQSGPPWCKGPGHTPLAFGLATFGRGLRLALKAPVHDWGGKQPNVMWPGWAPPKGCLSACKTCKQAVKAGGGSHLVYCHPTWPNLGRSVGPYSNTPVFEISINY